MDQLPETSAETEPRGLVSAIITGWALLGGVILVLVVVMHVWSVIGNQFGAPFPGDFELTEIGIAVAAFAFLPYCQLTGANVTADIFTSGASPRFIAFIGAVSSIIAFGFAALLLWRMYAGMLDQRNYGYETAVLQFPNWVAWLPILLSLALLILAATATFLRELRIVRRG